MAVALDSKKLTTDHLEQKFFELLAMDRSDERFAALFDEVHKAMDAEMALESESD